MNRKARRLLAVCGAGALLLQAAPASAASLPSDPQAVGVIGLCDQSLHPISRGNLADVPFVWRAVGGTPARGSYAKFGGTATLYAYQPRPSVPAGEWSGGQLTSSAHYTNPAYPMAQATKADVSLANFTAEFPPQVDGLIELRLYLGGPNLQLQTTSYDATFIRITGSTWTVVKGGSVDCTHGRAVSPETVLLPSSVVNPKPSTVSPGASASGTGSSSGATGAATAPASGRTLGAPASGSAPTSGTAVAASDHGESNGSSAGWIVLGAAGLLVLAVGAVFAVRRRRVS
ncbi:LPXTG cell wall anchor domain-containing protein [Jatrophihabitans sp.]|uniref:LPXTG cell wall anchor domain-containing protein n=1 Tax=Jatrophihabitans sp. TaxID=1932789 RepID=UPI0030C680FE|nr:hypothetical protein [Jatrophihabitans sp.]